MLVGDRMRLKIGFVLNVSGYITKCLLTVVSCLLLDGRVSAQEPSYEIFGGEALSGLTIFDQLMTKDEVLYIATSDGLYTYNSIDFMRIKQPPEVKGNFFFRLQEAENGDIFCTNVSGQLFQVRNNKMNIFYELSPDLIAPFNDYVIVKNGIIINALKTVLINKKGEFVRMLDKTYKYYSEERLYAELISPQRDSVTFNQVDIETLEDIEGTVFRLSRKDYGIPLYMNDEQFGFYENRMGELRSYYYKEGRLVKNKQNNLHPPALFVDDNTFWLKGHPFGVFETSIGEEQADTITFFKNKYAAPQTVNQHGIFLGSDGYGIYQIRNRFVSDIVQLNQYNILEIKKSPGGIITAKTSDRKVLLIDRDFNVKEIFKSENGNPYLFVDEANNDILIFILNRLYVYSISDATLKKYPSTLFGLKRVSNSNQGGEFLYTGTWHMGCFSITEGKVVRKVIKSGRGYSSIAFNGKNFFGAYEDILKIDPNTGDMESIRYQENSVAARRFLRHEERLFVQTAQNGLLEYKDGTLYPFELPFENLEDIREVFYDEGSLIVSDKKNLYVWNLYTDKKVQISRSDGLRSTNIKNAFMNNDQLVILTHLGIQVIGLKAFEGKELVPVIRFKEILMNGVSRTGTETFHYWQNRLWVELAGNAFGKQLDTKFRYQLEGWSDRWYEKGYYNNTIEYQSLPPGKYRLRIVPIYKGHEGKEISYSFTIRSPFWQTWWFFASCIALLLFGTFVLYRWYYSRKLQKIRIESEINKLRLTAIQSQMNPHFIFNSINGIQKSVLRKDRKSTYRHINKFAKLVRIILNHSNKEVIALYEEIELLQLYLELEKMRFTDGFEFSIESKANEHVHIPPMLIQPFVENAVIHGLFHKKGNKELKIEIVQEDVLSVIVSDNGIGRAASMVINEKRNETLAKSFATSAVEKRMKSLNQKYRTHSFGFEYIDLFDPNGHPVGTRVIIKLPIIKQ